MGLCLSHSCKKHLSKNKEIMRLLLIAVIATVVVGAVKGGSAPIYGSHSRHVRSPLFGLFGGCSGNCNRGKYNVGRALFLSGAAVGALGLATNNESLQRVGGSAAVGGLGLKGLANIFGKK